MPASARLLTLLDKWSRVSTWQDLAGVFRERQTHTFYGYTEYVLKLLVASLEERLNEYEELRTLLISETSVPFEDVPDIEPVPYTDEAQADRAARIRRLLGMVMRGQCTASDGAAIVARRVTVAAKADTLALPVAPEHAEDFAWVRCEVGEFEFTPKQRPLVRKLWQDWEKGGKGVSNATLCALTGDKLKHPRDAFRKNCAWNLLIVRTHGGVWRLNLPSPSVG
jgi:hypothetical protein